MLNDKWMCCLFFIIKSYLILTLAMWPNQANASEHKHLNAFSLQIAHTPNSPTGLMILPPSKPSPNGPFLGNGDIAGMFYGNPYAGDHTGNSQLFRHSASRRFRALRTGTVTAVTYENRVLTQANIDDRASGDNVWAKCRDAGLDEYTCGYTLGNSYSLGNGGLIRLELRPDDGTADHFPADTVLATTDTYVPMDNTHTKFPVFELNPPVNLQVGKIYHLVFLQLNPPVCGRGLSVEQARVCDRDKGMVGLNGTHYTAQLPNSPYGGETEAVLVRDSDSDQWHWDRGELPWYGLRYEGDNKWFGHMMAYYNGAKVGEAGGNRYVWGGNMARQRFTVQDKSYSVDGIWVRVDRLRSTTGELSFDVKQGVSVLATGVISAIDTVSNCDAGCSGDWVYTELSETVSFAQDQTYTVEFSADAASRFSLQSGFPLDYGAYKITEEKNGGSWWSSAQAEFSADGGQSWGPYSTRGGSAYHPKRDLSIVFTLVGGPRRMP